MIKKAGWFLLCVLMTASCLDEPDCFSLNNNILGVGFKRIATGRADTVFLKSVTIPDTDNVFIESTDFVGRSSFDVPLNYYVNNTAFNLHFREGDKDLLVSYTTKPQFVAEDCGERHVLSDLKVTGQAFDSIRLVNASPKRDQQTGTTVEILSCPKTTVARFKLSSSVSLSNVLADAPGLTYFFTKNSLFYVAVPLNSEASQTVITFLFSDNSSRQITLGYSKTIATLYTTCGEQPLLHDLKDLGHSFSSVTILSDSIQDSGIPNIALTY